MARSVRPSRDGDQFHYLWAARRCLLLLDPQSGLTAISIEGSSPSEASSPPDIRAGEQVIDMAEYYGNEEVAHARLVRYVQLKHSTLRPNTPWTASGLEQTLKGFSARYQEYESRFGIDDVAQRFEFCFVTNRPVSLTLRGVVDDTGCGRDVQNSRELKKLERTTNLTNKALAAFCRLLQFEDCQDSYWNQRNQLIPDVRQFLSSPDHNAPLRLKELVLRKALSEAENNPVIKKADVLLALGVNEEQLFPAKCQIQIISTAVPFQQEQELIASIRKAEGKPIIIHAAAGVGKTVFSTRIGNRLPQGSVCILYDCFGNGQYRSRSQSRHRHRDGLVQIANELAAKGLCYPLIPHNGTAASDYIRAFSSRLQHALDFLRVTDPDSVICIVIDAADNAQIAATEVHEEPSFVRDLLRESLPNGVRLVVLCRTHRQNTLDPPAHALRLELKPFSRTETAVHVHQVYPNASIQDVNEFHQRTSQNPRVQAYALRRSQSLEEVLHDLGPGRKSVESILDATFEKFRDDASIEEKENLDKICTGLATLRPSIPLSILSSITNVHESEITSFAVLPELNLLRDGELLQFRDEPIETWFRQKFQLSKDALGDYISHLKSLSADSVYAALTLPPLMLEADQTSELVDVALNSSALPESNDLERHEVERQRLQFAFKACIRSRRFLDAAKLALKGGWQEAGDSRRRTLLQDNTDLVATFYGADTVQELKSEWPGSNFLYEACLLSGLDNQLGEARSRLRLAKEWYEAWSQLPPDGRAQSMPSLTDIAQLAMAELNIHGVEFAANVIRNEFLSSAIDFPAGRSFSLDITHIVACRLIDHSRFSELNDLAETAGSRLDILESIIGELSKIQRIPPRNVVQCALQLVTSSNWKPYGNGRNQEYVKVRPGFIRLLVQAGMKFSLITRDDAGKLLSRFLPAAPPSKLSSPTSGMRLLYLEVRAARSEYLPVYCFKAVLANQPLELIDLAHPQLRSQLEKNAQPESSNEVRTFNQELGTLLPWYKLREEVLLEAITEEELRTALEGAKETSKRALKDFSVDSNIFNEVACIWFDVLCFGGMADEAALNDFMSWISGLQKPLFVSTLTALARQAAQERATRGIALRLAQNAFKLTESYRENAESKASDYIYIARAVLPVSKNDARAYFDKALEVAGKIGGESYSRWDAMLFLAKRAGRSERSPSEVAYRFARCAELTLDYLGEKEHIDWNFTVAALANLCPRSSLVILSRWHDRNIGWQQRILPIAVHALIEHNYVDPRDLVPLVGFRGEWNYATLLCGALSRCTSLSEKQAACKCIFRYAKLASPSATEWDQMRLIVNEHGLHDFNLKNYREWAAKREEPSNNLVADRNNDYLAHDDWDSIFSDCDFTTISGVSRSYASFIGIGGSQSQFFAEALKRIPFGEEASFIKAVGNSLGFSLFAFRDLIEQIYAANIQRTAITQVLKSTVKDLCRRNCMDILKSRYYEMPPFDPVFRMIGLEDSDLIDAVLAGVGSTPDFADSNRLFSLVGLIVSLLSHDEALEALIFGLDLLDPVLEESDGDGDWSDMLAPPTTIQESVAGYIYVGLAAPSAARRWEAAHAVLGLSALNRGEVLGHLVRYVTVGEGGPFADARLSFYKKHAKQWLMIAFSRAATEFSPVLQPHASLIMKYALKDQPHAMIATFAARTALALIKNGTLVSDSDLEERLENVNKIACTIEPNKTPGFEHRGGEDAAVGKEEDDFFFFPDFGPYWCARLGNVFDLSQREIEDAVRKVIRNEFHFTVNLNRLWTKDERSRRQPYDWRTTYATHGAYPDVDTLEFYLLYHAIMIVAGRLRVAPPLSRNPEADRSDKFAEWLSSWHDVTRDDGRWLADCRAPTPLERPSWLERTSDDPEYDLLTEADFRQVIMHGNTLNVWGRWSTANSARVQSIELRSALVSSDRSAALQRAFSSATGIHDCFVPASNSENQIGQNGFVLHGWIEDRHCDPGLDGKDRWSGEVPYPPPAPSPKTVLLMNLETDPDQGEWLNGAKITVMSSQMWGQYQERNRDHIHEKGSRLQASFQFVKDMLIARKLDLIVVVQVERRPIDRRYNSRPFDDDQTQRATGIYVVKADGSLTAV